MKQQGDFVKLKELMTNIYVHEVVDEKITEIEEGVNRKNKDTIQTISIKKVCCSPVY